MPKWKTVRHSVNGNRHMPKSCRSISYYTTYLKRYEHILEKKIAHKRKTEVDFSLTADTLQLLLEAWLDFLSKCEFQGESSESKRSKYGNNLDIMLKKYPEDQEKLSNKEKRHIG